MVRRSLGAPATLPERSLPSGSRCASPLARLRCRFGGLAIPSSAGLLAQVQSERPQFRASVELLQLNVVVLDDERRPVSALPPRTSPYRRRRRDADSRFTPDLSSRGRARRGSLGRRCAPDVVTNQVSEEDGRLVSS